MDESKLSITNRVVMAVHDNHRMSRKEIVAYLENSSTRATIEATVSYVAKQGLTQHCGYARYELTDLGREHVAKILKGGNPEINTKKRVKLPNAGEAIKYPSLSGTSPSSPRILPESKVSDVLAEAKERFNAQNHEWTVEQINQRLRRIAGHEHAIKQINNEINLLERGDLTQGVVNDLKYNY